jgi:hypothetical protein
LQEIFLKENAQINSQPPLPGKPCLLLCFPDVFWFLDFKSRISGNREQTVLSDAADT